MNHYNEAGFYKTASKSILGTMTDSIKMLEAMSRYDDRTFTDPVKMSLYLSEVPSLVMEAAYPKEAALSIFNSRNR